MAGAQSAPLAPCRNTSGGPDPPRIRRMLQPLTAIVEIVGSTIFPPPARSDSAAVLGAPPQRRGAAYHERSRTVCCRLGATADEKALASPGSGRARHFGWRNPVART